MKDILIKVQCPYCKFVNHFSHRLTEDIFFGLNCGYQTKFCNVEEGGCGETFAVHLGYIFDEQINQSTIKFAVDVFALVKVENIKTELKAVA